MSIAQTGRGLDGAELHALRSARRTEIAAELREVLGRYRLQRVELRGHDPHQGVEATHVPECAAGIVAREHGRQLIQLEEDCLEPQLARLMHDDEEKFIGVLGTRPRPLQREQLVEGEIRPVVYGRDIRPFATARRTQKVATSSDTMSSTSIVSAAKKGSP